MKTSVKSTLAAILTIGLIFAALSLLPSCSTIGGVSGHIKVEKPKSAKNVCHKCHLTGRTYAINGGFSGR